MSSRSLGGLKSHRISFAHRTTYLFDDLHQLAVIGLLKTAARFDAPCGRSFRPYARSYANGEITHYLWDHGFAIKMPPSWRDLYASGQKLLREGLPRPCGSGAAGDHGRALGWNQHRLQHPGCGAAAGVQIHIMAPEDVHAGCSPHTAAARHGSPQEQS